LPQDVDIIDDKSYLHPDVPRIKKFKRWLDFLAEVGNKKGMKILEVGSRVLTGNNFRSHFAEAKYVGFDYCAGDNVDIVGDAHKLSSYFDKDEKFDVIFSLVVFEHLAMPWIVAKEISKLLKVGGYVFIVTHFSYQSHGRPWHFFQFSDMGLKVLFSPALGFECMEAGMSLPMVGRFFSSAPEIYKNKPITGLYCFSQYLGKKVKEVENFEFDKVDLADIVGETTYPD
jgi:SAM-dependent methyltransferase